jgi:transposase InsO family protein/transposase-like protein
MSRRKSKSSSPPSGDSPGRSSPARERTRCGTFEDNVRQEALRLRVSGMPAIDVARRVGCSTETLRQWMRRAEQLGTLPQPLPTPPAGEEINAPTIQPESPAVPQRAPKDPGAGLGAHEVQEILSLKRRHPSMGPAQIRAQLKRFKGWRIAVRAIARVLERHGYELVHVASRPKGEEEPRRWEAPHRNALWQMDFVELRIGPERRALLLVLDDFSRYCVAHALFEYPTSEDVVEVLRNAIRRHGKPEAVYTDRGGPFLAWDKPSSLGRFLEAELIDHHVSRSYRPRGRGKVESLAATVRRELWDLVHFESVEDAHAALTTFFHTYNHRRAHMGLDGLTPADRFHGRWEEVAARVQAASRRRQGAIVSGDGRSGDPFVTEEDLPDGPVELLRLFVFRGRLELRFLGHRVDLGEVKP